MYRGWSAATVATMVFLDSWFAGWDGAAGLLGDAYGCFAHHLQLRFADQRLLDAQVSAASPAQTPVLFGADLVGQVCST